MISGTLLISASNAFRLGLQFVLLPILARMLGPDAYGLMALALPFILFVNILSDAGLGGALVREKNADPEVESTVFWSALGVSLVLAAALAGLAWPLAHAIHRPEAAPVIAALTPVLILGGVTGVFNARVLREHRFGVLAAGDVMSTTLSAICAISAAFLGFGVWSLVIQQIVLWAVKLTWLGYASKVRIRFAYKPDAIRRMLHFGLNGVGASLLDMVARSVDSLLIGSLLGVTALGYYAMSFQLVRMPEMLVVGPLYTVLFPAIAKAAGDPEKVAEVFVGMLRQMALLCAPILAGLAVVAGPLVEIALGEKWAPAVAVLAWLPIAGFVLCFTALATGLLFGLGHAHVKLKLSAITTVVTLIAVVVGARFGIVGVAMGLAAGSIVILGFAVTAVVREAGVPFRAMIGAVQAVALSTAVMVVAVEAAKTLMTHEPALLRLGVEVAVGVVAYGGMLLLTDRRRLLQDFATLRMQLQRRAAV